GAYITEAHVPENSKAVGMSLREIESKLSDTDTQIIGMVQNDVRMTAPNPWRKVHAGDILVVEAEPDALATVLSTLGLKMEEAVQPKKREENEENTKENDKTSQDQNSDIENADGEESTDEDETEE